MKKYIKAEISKDTSITNDYIRKLLNHTNINSTNAYIKGNNLIEENINHNMSLNKINSHDDSFIPVIIDDLFIELADVYIGYIDSNEYKKYEEKFNRFNLFMTDMQEFMHFLYKLLPYFILGNESDDELKVMQLQDKYKNDKYGFIKLLLYWHNTENKNF